MVTKYGGDIELTVVEAVLSRDTNLITRMDPQAVIQTKGAEYKTKVQKRAGKDPHFGNTKFNIPIQDVNEKLKVIVFGQGKDICGQTELTVQQLTECGEQNRWYNIDW